jgi:UDP-N-acetylmuramate dehydrogenase
VKLSAAWLIENSGIHKGFCLPGSKAAISSKHALAITNRGDATADEVTELARYIQTQVSNKFGINLVPEPNLIGF